MGVLFECQRAGIAVPHRMAICGFNDLDMMHVAYPSLTSVRTPRYDTGRLSVQMVLDRLAGRPIESPIVDLGFELQVRESTTR